MAEGAGVALVNAAQAIYASARAHKASEAHHRRQAQKLMAELDVLRRECARHGIELKIDTAPQGGIVR